MGLRRLWDGWDCCEGGISSHKHSDIDETRDQVDDEGAVLSKWRVHAKFALYWRAEPNLIISSLKGIGTVYPPLNSQIASTTTTPHNIYFLRSKKYLSKQTSFLTYKYSIVWPCRRIGVESLFSDHQAVNQILRIMSLCIVVVRIRLESTFMQRTKTSSHCV